MVESISKSVEEQDEIQFSYIGELNNGYGNNQKKHLFWQFVYAIISMDKHTISIIELSNYYTCEQSKLF